MKRIHSKLILLASILIISSPGQALEQQVVKGSGASTTITAQFFEQFNTIAARYDVVFSVENQSSKHAGGIKASDDHLFGRTGRPLTDEERGTTKEEIVLARIPLSFVVGDATGVSKITIGDLSRIYSKNITNWKQLGGADHAIELVGREQTESSFQVIKHDQYFMRAAIFDRIFTKDEEVVDYIASPEGSYAISFGARSNFDAKNLLEIKGFHSNIPVGLVYDRKNKDNPLVKEAKKYSTSLEWHDVLMKSDFLTALD